MNEDAWIVRIRVLVAYTPIDLGVPAGQRGLTIRRFMVLLATATALVFVLPTGPTLASVPTGNGLLIAFVTERPHGIEIDTIRRNGTDLHRLIYGNGDANTPDWSPDGTRLVFELDHPSPSTSCSIEIVNAGGSGLVDLTGQRAGCEQDPSFTPDGRRVVFSAQRCVSCVDAIWSMNLQGGDRRKIRLAPPGLEAVDPLVSPDGKTLSFVGELRAGKRGLYSVNMNGSHLERIVPLNFDVGTRHGWAPDGHRMVFTQYSENLNGHRANVVVVRPDGTGWVQITHEAGMVSDGGASYSPDGRWIVYRHEDDQHGTYAIFKMHSDGADQTRIRGLLFAPQGIDWEPPS